MNLPLFIATRLYKDKNQQQQVSRPAIRIAVAAVAIGLAVIIISLSVVLGFKHTIRDKVIGFGSHISVGALSSILANEPCPIQINDSMLHVLSSIEGVRHVQRYAYKKGILKTDSDFLGVVFKGIAEEYDTTFIHQNIIHGTIPQFSAQTNSRQIVISKTIADKLKLNVGDNIYAYFISKQGPRPRKYNVAAIYQTNLAIYDRTICLTDLYSAVKLNDWQHDQVSGAEITAQHFDQLQQVHEQIIKHVNKTHDAYGQTFSSLTIQDMNPQIFSWLELLDVNALIILALMLAVAAFTIISALLIIILEKTSTIGLFKALGAKNKTIRHTFLCLATFILARGIVWGNIIAIAILILQKYLHIVKLEPETYYVTSVPVEINIPAIIIINIITITVSVLVLIAPSQLISHINPAQSIHYQ